MQKSIRPGVVSINRISPRRRIFFEALNPYFGYFYTVKKSIRKAASLFQDIELVETDEFGKVLLIDNITQIGERDDCSYHEPMVHPALCCHPKPESVLVIGGGDGCLLREVLKYPTVTRVELAEIDHGVIQFSKKYLAAIHRNAFDSERLHINITDGRKYTGEHPGEFDVIIMDMTDPFGPSKMLYTSNFFRLVRRAFRNEKGIFVMHSESPVSRPAAFSCIGRTLRSVFSHVNQLYLYIQMYGVLWSVAVCSTTVDISLVKQSSIDRTLKKYGIDDLQVYNGATHAAMQIPYPYIKKLLQKPARIITDNHPDFPDDFIF
ncbi:MAG: polyamine aminopropyltransferase [Chitinispirillaceae bacterium]|nr:polyamine aminopropyltransferase [Chitinispirillaceae bacterium]